MIESVWVENQNGDLLDINMRTSQDNLGVLIFNTTGLGSPVATVNGSAGPRYPGKRVNSVTVDARSIQFTLAIPVQGDAEEDARALVYQFFPEAQEIVFGVQTSRNAVYIRAIVEQVEMNIFSKVVNAAISLYCPQPYFIDTSVREFTINTGSGTPKFSFPFSNESLLLPLILFGNVTSKPTATIDYTGGTATGCDISILFGGNVGNITINNSNGAQEMTLHMSRLQTIIGGSISSGDQLVMNTRMGEKKVTFVHGGTEYNAIGIVGIHDDWLQIKPGRNLVVVTAESGEDYLETDIKFSPLRSGI